MQRLPIAVLAALLVAPSVAADWGHYVNPRFGYAIDVPPGLVGQGESDNGDGQVFKTPTATLTVFGGYILDGSFEDQVKTARGYAEQAGWQITYAVSTPNGASFSGVKSGRVSYSRLVPLCGPAFAEFDLEYSRSDLQKLKPVIDRLVASLKPTSGSVACPSGK
jgi:hypothetical protein